MEPNQRLQNNAFQAPRNFGAYWPITRLLRHQIMRIKRILTEIAATSGIRDVCHPTFMPGFSLMGIIAA